MARRKRRRRRRNRDGFTVYGISYDTVIALIAWAEREAARKAALRGPAEA